MINMFCDNCGAKIDANEKYCPNCGMQLFDSPPTWKKKKKTYENSESFTYNYPKPVEKPIKGRYIGTSDPESPDYSQYEEYRYENEHPEENYYEDSSYGENYKEKSGSGIGTIFIFLVLALVLGLVVGMIIFTSQSTPPIPGFTT